MSVKIIVSDITIWLFVSGWVVSLSCSLGVLLKYSYTPGPFTHPPVIWPQDSVIQRDNNHSTLLIFAHPRCPCTKATFCELERIIADCERSLSVHIIFIDEDGVGSNWLHSELWKKAECIPGVVVHVDKNGTETNRFKVNTSGHSMLYGSHGSLVFSGGITSSRGHQGDNYGREAILEFINNGKKPNINSDSFFVFGCRMQNKINANVKKVY